MMMAYGLGLGGFGGLGSLLLMVLLVVGGLRSWRSVDRGVVALRGGSTESVDAGLRVLRERYAHGEVDHGKVQCRREGLG